MSAANYLFLETSTVVLFGLLLWHAWRRGTPYGVELLSAAVYGILLEWGDILLFGTYTYSQDFSLAIGPVPIIIGLCWAMLIYGAMAYSDQIGLPPWAAPFADALWAILLDLAFDAVAIRLEFWTWTIPLDAGFYGVPAANFHAWLYVALGFSAWTRWVRSRARNRAALQWTAPLAAYVPLVAAILLFDFILLVAYPPSTDGGRGMLIFATTLVLFALIVGSAVWRGVRPRRGVDLAPTLARWAMHGYFGGWLVLWLVFPQTRLPGMDAPPMLLLVSALALVAEAIMLVPVLVAPQTAPMPRSRTEQRTTPAR
jgi:hypothetical protein